MSRNGRHLFTSESVTEGHPDKIADQISDAILDAILAQDPDEPRRVRDAGHDRPRDRRRRDHHHAPCVDYQEVVRATITEVGYTRGKYGFDAETCAVLSSIHSQSPDIAMGVDTGGAGDQGLMFGFACTETDELMPLPIMLAHKLAQGPVVRAPRRRARLPAAGRQVAGHGRVRRQHAGPRRRRRRLQPAQPARHERDDAATTSSRRSSTRVIPAELMDKNTKIYINPTGRFVVGGPHGDAGVTGRKIIVDTYGGAAPHGGGAFSGKDPTKVDRSACYMARYIAKNVVAAGLAERALVQLAYAIGVADPVSVMVDTDGTGRIAGGEDHRARARALQADAARHHRGARPAPADLQEDRGVRPLRPHRAGVHLGADRQGRGAASRRRRL